MRPSDIRCRLCDYPYSIQDHGCDVCIPAKNAVVWPDIEGKTDLELAVDQQLRFMRDLTDALEHDFRTRTIGKGKYVRFYGEEGTKLAKAMAQLGAEARKLQAEMRRQAMNMTFDEKIEAVTRFVEQLPSHQKKKLIAKLDNALLTDNQLPPGAFEDAEFEEMITRDDSEPS